MNSPENIEVVVRYLGIIRLLTGRQTDRLTLARPAALRDVAAALKEQLPSHVYAEVERQTLLLSSGIHMPGSVVTLLEDADRELEPGSCLTIVTPVTGG